MAVATTGITAAWGSTALGEVTEIKWVHGGSLPQSRGATAAGTKPWSLDLGTVEVSFLAATASTVVGQWGRKGTLLIGGTATLTTKAVVQTLDIGAKVNDVWRYKGTFKIVQE